VALATASHARSTRLALAVAVIGALALSGTAAGTAACGEAVLDDWFDNGRVERLYDLQCYGEAMDAIPSDIRDYSDAEEVISRALQVASRGRLARGGVDPTPGGVPRKRGAGQTPPIRAHLGSIGRQPLQSVPPVRHRFRSRFSFLAGLSLALLGAGGLGHASRRRVERDDSREDARG
jgi:hypothetical protein